MKALFIGGTGTISSACSALALQRGWEVTLLNRGTKSRWAPPGASTLAADINDEKSVLDALGARTFDVVADFIAYTAEDARRDMRLFAGKCAQFVFISSTAAYQKPARLLPMRESTPLYNPYWDYAQHKIEAEDVFNRGYRENQFPVTIVRPSLTYGNTAIPYCLNSRVSPFALIERLRAGKTVIVPGDGTSPWTITHSTDFAKAFVGLMGNQRAIGDAFHITSDEVLTWDLILEAIADAAGAKANRVHMASDFICARYPHLTGTLLGDKSNAAIFDNSKVKSLVPDFVCTTTFANGIRDCVAHYDLDPRLRAPDPQYHAMIDDLLKAYGALE